MSNNDPESRKRSELLSRALRAVRRVRPMRTREIAAAMGMPPRTYEHFEAGGGRFSLDNVLSFAKASDSDPFAILIGVLTDSPDLAAHCADNKMLIAFAMALRELNADLGPEIRRLETSTLVMAFAELFEGLAAKAREQGEWTRKWLDESQANGGSGSNSDTSRTPEDGRDRPQRDDSPEPEEP